MEQWKDDEVSGKDPLRFQHTVVSDAHVSVDKSFYAQGLHFSCPPHCSGCCGGDPGPIYLRKKDLELLVSTFKVTQIEFIDRYCIWVSNADGVEELSLKEVANYDCIFWENRCSVYEARPVQCSTYPFWPTIFNYSNSWEATGIAMGCPGMGKGKLYTAEEIESFLDQQKAEPVITKESIGLS